MLLEREIQTKEIPLVVPNGRLQTGTKTLKPTELRTSRRIFILSRPLKCTIEKIGANWHCSNAEFEIYVFAPYKEAAQAEFASAFNELYEAYGLSDAKDLHQSAVELKNQILGVIAGVFER